MVKRNCNCWSLSLFLLFLFSAGEMARADDVKPYTRGARKAALEIVGNNIALFPGSRYSYVEGKKVRLDNDDKLGCWSIVKDGKLYVPESFAPVIAADNVAFDEIPEDLKILEDRWVYEAKVKDYVLPISRTRCVHRLH